MAESSPKKSSRLRRAAASFLGPPLQIVKRCGEGYRRGQLLHYLEDLRRLSGEAARNLAREFHAATHDHGAPRAQRVEELHTRTKGLHVLLPLSSECNYSILVAVTQPRADLFRETLVSLARQTAPRMEILLGFDAAPHPSVEAALRSTMEEFPASAPLIRSFYFERAQTDGRESKITNLLANYAENQFLLPVGQTDWLRPDLLYRFELAIRLATDDKPTLLCCDEFELNDRDGVIRDRQPHQSEQPSFPYVFRPRFPRGLLIPRPVWTAAGGLRPECEPAALYDFCLRAELLGCPFEKIPLPLYARRRTQQDEQTETDELQAVATAQARSLRDYAAVAGLDWNIRESDEQPRYHVKPVLDKVPSVQVILPYRDQVELTVECVKSVVAQRGVHVDILAVDNRSQDKALQGHLESLGARVVEVNEPFNFSRLNNQAVDEATSDNLLFLNNDVVLEPEAIVEMARWLRQPGIGVVGARLMYPDSTLQHGGIDLARGGTHEQLDWTHTEIGVALDALEIANNVRTVEAVTAACLLIRREVFAQVGGFDELNYPIAYSDTDLCRRVREVGFRCLYTPFAAGVHNESASRQLDAIEDWERSRWVFNRVKKSRDTTFVDMK